jgi:hypothetical protein
MKYGLVNPYLGDRDRDVRVLVLSDKVEEWL